MLFDIANAQISKLIIHKIGSRNDNTENTYSERCVEFKEDNPVLGLLKQYFLATFNEPNLYHFTATNGDLNSNIVYQSANSIFDSNDTFTNILGFWLILYWKSRHTQTSSLANFI